MRKRRFEILLPLRHNDGTAVDGLQFELTREELIAEFGAITLLPHTARGTWTHEDQRYEDELLRLVVDVEDSPENIAFFQEFKKTLLERFDQVEIYIASFPVDLL